MKCSYSQMNLLGSRPPLMSLRQNRHSAEGQRGFTMLELMVVITIILILVSIGIGRYQQSVLRAKESSLKQDLSVMRQAIQQYTLDKEAAPQSLDDLVSAGYLGGVPVDPITRAKDWQTVSEDVLLSPDQTTTGITDVHSGSDQVSPFEHTAYSSW
jgi:general secretion pathway protein G